MDLVWHLHRLKKMSLAELAKRFGEYLKIYYSSIQYRHPTAWPYSRFAPSGVTLELQPMPGLPLTYNPSRCQIYSTQHNLTNPLDWFASDVAGQRWPACHYARIDYRPGNPYGDVRYNWELNRLQFLPLLAVSHEELARKILLDWMDRNPYVHGPAYLASMEVALRWFSIYWAVCLFREPLDGQLLRNLTGLAVASGKFIENRLSTHSSAGNHLILEAVGLFWLGRALQASRYGAPWVTRARRILCEETGRQISPDGSNREQSFWYLGFVLDALFHYLLLEEEELIPATVKERMQHALSFVDDMTLPDGGFPDYGDRDDGFVFRTRSTYAESLFCGLLNLGAHFFQKPAWCRDTLQARERLAFWTGSSQAGGKNRHSLDPSGESSALPSLKTYPDGGMTLMRWGGGRVLFRHAPLGLGNTCGHGHADALSILFWWNSVPLLIDLGSGHYNGDQKIRNFFRSTIAHNTSEVGGRSQAKMLGPFMWEKSYRTEVDRAATTPVLTATAHHDGYLEEFGVVHTRQIRWSAPPALEIIDSFSGPAGVPVRGAFHLGRCSSVALDDHRVDADFGDFIFSLTFSSAVTVEVFHGSAEPFMGWRSMVYGKWEPAHAIEFSAPLPANHRIITNLAVTEKRK